MIVKCLTGSLVAIFFIAQAHAVLINEILPNPVGGDPAMTTVELLGTPGASYTGVLVALESDGANGSVNNTGLAFEAISGTFDSNGLLTGMVTDFENPSFTLILADAFSGDGTSDLDATNDGVLDAAGLALFTNIQDAVNVPDSAADFAAVSYGSDAGGTDLPFIGDEPQLIFRDSVSLEWFLVDDVFGVDPDNIFDSSGALSHAPSFNIDPLVDTFGSVNPTIPEPATALLVLFGLCISSALGMRARLG